MTQNAAAARSDVRMDWLMDAAARMLRPIIRIVIGRISCSAFVSLIQEIYVEEAKAHLQRDRPDGRVTTSALSLLSGIDGRTIQELESRGTQHYLPGDINSAAHILELWSTDPLFTTDGTPDELLIHGPGKTFARLVNRAAGRHVTPNTALERLEESGNVEVSGDRSSVRMRNRYYMPIQPSDRASIDAGSFSLHKLGQTVAHNILGLEDEKFLQQDRWSTYIPKTSVPAVRKELRALMQRQIGEVEEMILAYEDPDSPDHSVSVGAGWYYWDDEHPLV